MTENSNVKHHVNAWVDEETYQQIKSSGRTLAGLISQGLKVVDILEKMDQEHDWILKELSYRDAQIRELSRENCGRKEERLL